MKFGISASFPHKSPEEWAMLHKAEGLESVVFPLDHTAPQAAIDGYLKAANDAGLLIAEVGAWSNPLSPDRKTREEALNRCIRQTELADYVGACCCVNISGAIGEIWDAGYPENYAPETYDAIVACVQKILDTAKPTKTFYALEPMPNMLPDSPESYVQLIRDVDRPRFGAHLDVVNMLASPRIFFANRDLVDRSVALLGKHIRSCHIKDARIEHQLTVSILETECGTGGLDLKYYMDRIDALNPDLPMILEHLPSTESYRKSAAYIQTLRRG